MADPFLAPPLSTELRVLEFFLKPYAEQPFKVEDPGYALGRTVHASLGQPEFLKDVLDARAVQCGHAMNSQLVLEILTEERVAEKSTGAPHEA